MFPAIVNMVIGIALLTTGRRLYWVFVGAAGFILGSSLAQQLLTGQPSWMTVTISLITGVVGVVIAILAQRFAVGFAGFVLGSYALASLFFALGLEGTGWMWLALFGGGILALTLALAVLDFTLIFLSSIAGAELIVQTIQLNPTPSFVLFAILFGVGITIQLIMLRK
jgi:hypothetical protein